MSKPNEKFQIPKKLPQNIVHCVSCTKPLIFIYDPRVRDTCDDCGGKSKIERPSAKKKKK